MRSVATRVAAVVAALCAVTLVTAGCSGGTPPPDPGSAAPSVTEYVGTLAGVDVAGQAAPGAYFLALAVDAAGAVNGYMCDGANRGDGAPELFTGRVDGDRLQLTSESGRAILNAAITPAQVTGDVRLGGQSRPFTLAAARGVGGLYTAAVAGDQSRLTGRSERGNTYELARPAAVAPGAVLTAPVRSSDGQALQPALQFALDTGDSGYSQYRQVVLDDGNKRGNRTKSASATSGSGGSGFTDPIIW